jgi:type I restriction enzyme S subunit
MMTATQKIPSGYKQTETGVIPEDWDVKEVKELAVLVASGKSKTASELGSYPIYGSTGVIGYRKQPDYSGKKVLIARVGANAGTVNMVSGEYCVSDNTLMITYRPDVDINFSYYQLINFKLNRLIFGSGQPLVTGTQVKQVVFPIPRDKQEQTVIAFAISDADAQIDKMKLLIEKKKNIKRGVMQELLTGKKRLPGFNGDWEMKLLSDVSWFQEGPGVRTSQFTSAGIKLLNGTNIYKGKLLLDSTSRYISELEAYGPYAHFLVDEGDIVIASSGITIDKFEEKISFVRKEHLPICMNTSTIRFKICNNLLDPLFLYYFFMCKKFKDQLGAQATGSAQLNFGPSHMEKVEIFIPNDKNEQSAITTILSDMDTEIEKLELQLTKYQNIKQGMMQTLLTGKIRLITK